MKFFGILMILAALWVFLDARGRNYSSGEVIMWSVGAFFLPLVVVPLYFIWRKPALPHRWGPGEGPIIDITPEIMHCNRCGKTLESGWIVCPYCGEKDNRL